jgi:uncharacterized protein YbcC (UPF0753/DUF2309 family)
VIQQVLEMPGMVMATAMVKEMAKEMEVVEMTKEMEVVEMTKEMEVVEMKEMVMTTVEVVEEVEVAMGIYLRNRILCT